MRVGGRYFRSFEGQTAAYSVQRRDSFLASFSFLEILAREKRTRFKPN
jgi:hypothetical protein